VVTRQQLVGKTGSVTMRVRGGELPGEVRVVVAGIPHYYIAYCNRPVPTGTPVIVVNARGARQVDVEPWQVPGTGAECVASPTEAM
jgi:membrane protein implicated in regulation of membrane protease activity